MTINKFAPKGEEVLRKEVVDNYGLDPEENKEIVDKIVADRLKDEQFKASLHEDKKKHLKAKEFYKNNLTKAGFDPKTGEPIKKDPPKGDNNDQEAKIRQIVAEEQFIASGRTHTELRQLKKIMAATGKDFYQAQKDSLFTAFLEKQEREQTSRNSQLPPSRGGSFTQKTEKDEIADKNMGNLPPGFSAEAPKK